MFRSIISAFAKSGPREGIPLGRSTVVVPPALHQLCPQPSLQNPIFNETGAFFFSTTARSNVAQQYQYQQKTQQRDKQQQQHRQQRRPLRSRQDATASTSASLSLRPLPQQQTPQPSTKSMRFKKSLTDMFIENNNNTMSMSELFLQSHNLLSTTTTTTDPNVVAMQPPPPPQQQQQQHWRQYNPSHPQQQQQQRRRRSNRSRYATNTTTTTTTTTRYPSNDDDNNRQQNGINSSSSSSNNTNVTTSSTTTTYDTAFGAHAVRGGANKMNYSNNDHNHDNLRFRGSRRRGTTTTTTTITTATTRRYITKAAASEASITTLDTKNNNDNINSDNNASSKPSSSSSSSSSEETAAAGEVRHHHHHRLRQYLVVSPTEFDNVLYHLLRINSQSKVVVFAQTATLAKVYGKRLANAGIKNIWIGAGDDKHEQLKDSYAAFQFARAGVFVCTVHAFASVCPSNSNNDNDNDVGLVIVAGAFVNSNVYYQIGDTNAAAADATHGRIITLLRDFEKNAIDHAAKEQSSSGEGGGGAFGGGIHENFGEQIDYSDIVRMSPRSIASLGPWLNRKKSLAFDALCDLLGYLVTNQSPTTWQFSNMRDVLAGLRAIAQSYGMSHLPISGDQARKLGIVEEDFRFLTSHIRPSSYSTTSSGDAEQASIADDGTTSTNNKEQQRQSSYAQILGFR